MFDSIVGHTREKNILSQQLLNQSFSHAYLFTGPEGLGKKALAVLFAEEVIKNGLSDKDRKVDLIHPDLFTYGMDDSKVSIKDIRDLKEETLTKPLEGDYRVFIIDNADTLNPYAQNALLKTLEEPNPGNIIILISANPDALLPTIKSRCQNLAFHDLPANEKKDLLEGLDIDTTKIDLSETPGKIIDRYNNPEEAKRFEELYKRFNKIIQGDFLEAFELSEELSKDKEYSKEVIAFFIRKLHQNIISNEAVNKNNIFLINKLIELLEKLAYNVNLRLQWENCLLQIIMEQ